MPSADPIMSDAGSLPIIGTLRVGFTFAVGGTLVNELLSGGSGLGALIVEAMQLMNIDTLFATVLVVFLLTGLITGLLKSFEARAMRST
jgi:ABC-type nitrate/sulfonate/bicarbonate transport system permease component